MCIIILKNIIFKLINSKKCLKKKIYNCAHKNYINIFLTKNNLKLYIFMIYC